MKNSNGYMFTLRPYFYDLQIYYIANISNI